jgi:hypothetical protein
MVPSVSKSVRNTDAEANVVIHSMPRFGQCADGLTHLKRHEHSLKRRVLHWHRIIQDDHHTVAGVTFERAVVLDDDFADSRMVVA